MGDQGCDQGDELPDEKVSQPKYIGELNTDISTNEELQNTPVGTPFPFSINKPVEKVSRPKYNQEPDTDISTTEASQNTSVGTPFPFSINKPDEKVFRPKYNEELNTEKEWEKPESISEVIEYLLAKALGTINSVHYRKIYDAYCEINTLTTLPIIQKSVRIHQVKVSRIR